jgi:hypothetical protein
MLRFLGLSPNGRMDYSHGDNKNQYRICMSQSRYDL